jgi:hypothetical protein
MWSILLVSLFSAAGPPFEIDVLGGDRLVGPIVRLDADRLTVQAAKGPVTLEMQKIAGLSRQGAERRADAPPGVWVQLIDGSQLVGSDYSARNGSATMTGPGGKVTELSTRDVRAVRLQSQTDAIAAEWARLLESNSDGDLLVVRKADSIDYHRGVLQNVTDKVVELELDGERLPVKRSKIQGLLYYRSTGRSLPNAVCRITDSDGSIWQARSIRLEGENFCWTTPLGLEVSCPAGSVVRIDFSRGKIVYLSDLEPESALWTPYFGSGRSLPAMAKFFGPREDRGLEPGALQLDGKPYQKGLALHSRTNLVYRLPGRFRRFQATVGIDDRVRPRGNVLLVIRGDDRILLETTVAGTDPAQAVDLDLGGVRRLAILVDYGDLLDVADHLDLCDARIVK